MEVGGLRDSSQHRKTISPIPGLNEHTPTRYVMGDFDPTAHASNPTTPDRRLFPTGPSLVEVAWAEKTVSNNGKERLTFRLKAVAGSHTDENITVDCYLTPDAAWKLASLSLSCGVTEKFDPDNQSDLLKLFVGKQMKITVAPDLYTNRDGMEVMGRKISTFQSLDPEVARKQMAERNAAIDKARNNGSSNAPIPTATVAGEGEEIPF